VSFGICSNVKSFIFLRLSKKQITHSRKLDIFDNFVNFKNALDPTLLRELSKKMALVIVHNKVLCNVI